MFQNKTNMSTQPKVNMGKLNELLDNGGIDMVYHFLRHDASYYMFEDFPSILIFNEVKAGNQPEQHNNILTMLGKDGI